MTQDDDQKTLQVLPLCLCGCRERVVSDASFETSYAFLRLRSLTRVMEWFRSGRVCDHPATFGNDAIWRCVVCGHMGAYEDQSITHVLYHPTTKVWEEIRSYAQKKEVLTENEKSRLQFVKWLRDKGHLGS